MQAPMENPRSASERVWTWLETTLRERNNPEGTFQKGSRHLKRALTVGTFVYLLTLLVLLFLLDRWGERNWFLSILLFVPPVLWLTPLILLTPFHCLIRPKLCWVTVAAALVLGFGYLDFNLNFSSGEKTAGLTLLTNNVGGRKFSTLAEFMQKENPDIVALQDTARFGNLARQYPERFIANLGEYILISKLPIRQSRLLADLSWRGHPIGTWHELQYGDQSIVVYNIHMPTPRQEFTRLRGRGFLVELFGGKGIYSSDVRAEYKEFVEQRIELSQKLLQLLQNEKRPFLIAGDFNMPRNGYLSRLFHKRFIDAFETKGNGYGFTFPGETSGLLNLFGAWLRIDYLFSGKNWHPLSCEVEPRGEAEHRAVVARFELTPAAHKP